MPNEGLGDEHKMKLLIHGTPATSAVDCPDYLTFLAAVFAARSGFGAEHLQSRPAGDEVPRPDGFKKAHELFAVVENEGEMIGLINEPFKYLSQSQKEAEAA